MSKSPPDGAGALDNESEENQDSEEENTTDEENCEYEKLVTSQEFKKKYQAQCQWNLTKPCAEKLLTFKGDKEQIGKCFLRISDFDVSARLFSRLRRADVKCFARFTICTYEMGTIN